MGERQRTAGCRPARPAPSAPPDATAAARGAPRARLGGDRSQHVDIGGAPAGAAQQRLGDLRPGPHPVGELRVEQREPRRPQRPPGRSALEQLVGRPVGGCSRSPAPTSSVAVRSPTRTSTASSPRAPAAPARRARRRTSRRGRCSPTSASSTLTVASWRARDAAADVELLGEVVVEIEQVARTRRAIRRRRAAAACVATA